VAIRQFLPNQFLATFLPEGCRRFGVHFQENPPCIANGDGCWEFLNPEILCSFQPLGHRRCSQSYVERPRSLPPSVRLREIVHVGLANVSLTITQAACFYIIDKHATHITLLRNIMKRCRQKATVTVLGIWRSTWKGGRARILSMFFFVMMAATTRAVQTTLQAGSPGI